MHRETHGRIQGRKGRSLRQRRLKRTHGLCEHCLAKGLDRTASVVDHVKALANGGEDIDSNTQNLCHPCHAIKTAQDFGHRQKQEIGTDGWPI